MGDIFSEIKPKKRGISITLDEELIKKLEQYKISKGIFSLSPVINAMLWNWLKKEEESN